MLRLCLMHSDWLQILRSQSDRLKQTLRKFTLQFFFERSDPAKLFPCTRLTK